MKGAALLNTLNKKGQLPFGGYLILLVGIVIVIAVLVPVTLNVVGTNPGSYNYTNTYTNTNGTNNAAKLNAWINSYENANITYYSTVTSVTFKGTANATTWVKLFVNGVATTTNFRQATATNASYPVDFNAHSTYILVVSSNKTGVANVTHKLTLEPHYVVVSAPNGSTIDTLLLLVPLLIAVLAIIYVVKQMGIF